ncbi:MAG: hypothetical protein AUK47_24130 [Deltaproteobacteria bacterium CG2_30_63_29]|nr:MAG: hypothetical protein AUK47_24130 [Deltaproteobacteria bacterium CG2_30_63_29]PJB41286.1 MAG: hypothetical protein CO108_13320 [Deltaproteobacteria bacterium CG_4_9_14_3_um_filter_63_12]
MLIFGIILIVVGIGLFIAHRFKLKSVYEMRMFEQRNTADLLDEAGTIAAELGAGSFEQSAQLVGDIVCDQPLTSQLGEHSCVYYRMSVRRKYDEEYWEKDNNGNQVRKTRTGTDVVSDTKESCPFYVKDETGKLLVVPDGAKFDSLIESVSRFEPATMGGLGGIGFGRFQLTPPMMQGSGRRTLGYHYEEHVLPLNRRVTIMGQVNDKMGQLAMRKADGQKLFISTRSKEEMVGSAQKTAQVMFASAIGSAVIGVVLAIIGAVS